MSPPRWEDLQPTQTESSIPNWDALEPIGVAQEPPSALETAAPTLFKRFMTPTPGVRQAIDLAKGVGTGAVETVKGIPAFLSSVMGAPKQVSEDVKALVASPETALPQFAERAGRFAWQMVPFARTLGGLLRGQVPTATQIGEEAGGLATAVAIPRVVGGAAKRISRAAVKEIPGAGVELHALAIPQAEALAARMQPGMESVRAAYRASKRSGNPQLDMSRLRQVAQEVLEHERAATKPRGDLISQAENILKTSEEGWDWRHATSEVRRIGEQQRAIKKIEGEVPKELTDLYSALRESLEDARPLIVVEPARRTQAAGRITDEQGRPLIPAQGARAAVTEIGETTPQMAAQTATWLRAQKTARRQFAGEELADRINAAVGRSGEDFSSFSVNRISKWIDQQERAARLGHPDTKARRFVQSFEGGELQDIKATLHEISRNLAALPTTRGTPVGSSQRALWAALGGLVGETVGIKGAPFGAGGAVGIVLSEAISRGMQTGPGRALVRRAMKIDPSVGPLFTAIVYGGLTGAREEHP